MQRTRLTIVAAALFAAMPLLHAQNNPYQIHDSCYVYMVKADALIGRYDRADKSVFGRIPSESLALLSSVAEKVSRPYVALDLKNHCIRANRSDFAWLLEANLAEMNARYENDRLQASLQKLSRQRERYTSIAQVLGLLLLLVALLSLLFYIRNLRRARKKDEEMIASLTAANEKVRLADAAKDRFIQNMTHELRTPLNAITGFSQLLAMPDGMFSSEEKEDFGRHVINGTRMMTMLLDDFVQGTGLGLSICREIATKMGGKVYLDTANTGGSRFVFAVPLS